MYHCNAWKKSFEEYKDILQVLSVYIWINKSRVYNYDLYYIMNAVM